ncbi:MAG: aminotransferase class I/II-fold pyridoxal phosphate-dependent enzyme [Candidatus Bathyarchaeota archaeon]|nr:MAG: aminotransferase class I/II-fold pyridoxal phosphate-dependent enzyme [Candidatus Bathyarchaeota archaeon]
MNLTQAERVTRLPPYIFAEIEKLLLEKKRQGVSIISLSIGDPDLPPPPFILNDLHRESRDPQNHHYSLSQGEPTFRTAVANWYHHRFNVDLNPDTEVIALIGSKEGIANVTRAFINPGDSVLAPNPAYPVYANGGTILSDGVPLSMPLVNANGYQPDLDQVAAIIHDRPVKMMYLNYPNNPTAAVADLSFLRRVVDFATEHNIILCYDNAYSEITFDGYRAPSLLEVPGAKEIAIEFNSCSKTFNMTGDRIGFAVGNEQLIEGLRKVKSQIDSGPPVYVQNVITKALENYYTPRIQQQLDLLNRTYQERRDVLIKGLTALGFNCPVPKATFYVWLNCGEDSMKFTAKLLDNGVAVTPGIGFGSEGKTYVRFSITRPKEAIAEACERLSTLD